MGLDAATSRFLLHAHKMGVDFSQTAMIGRQGMYLHPHELQRNLDDYGFSVAAESLLGYAEPFLRLLGAKEIVSFDASDYEGAEVVHDFNLPLDKRFHSRFTVVIDGGSLEHIFNFPQAVGDCMRMVGTGGHFIGMSPTNNFSGHGFYQFSPELFFKVFSPTNGFVVKSMMSSEEGTTWKEIPNPEVAKQRVRLDTQKQTMLLVLAQKTAEMPLGSIQQSDYTALWSR